MKLGHHASDLCFVGERSSELLSGPKESHQKFWEMLQKHIEIEDPTSVDRVLGRRHIITRMNVA